MASEDIKTGSEVVSEFLESLQGDESIDADTLDALRDLFKLGKLSKTQLLKSLELLRNKVAVPDAELPGGDTPGHD